MTDVLGKVVVGGLASSTITELVRAHLELGGRMPTDDQVGDGMVTATVNKRRTSVSIRHVAEPDPGRGTVIAIFAYGEMLGETQEEGLFIAVLHRYREPWQILPLGIPTGETGVDTVLSPAHILRRYKALFDYAIGVCIEEAEIER